MIDLGGCLSLPSRHPLNGTDLAEELAEADLVLPAEGGLALGAVLAGLRGRRPAGEGRRGELEERIRSRARARRDEARAAMASEEPLDAPGLAAALAGREGGRVVLDVQGDGDLLYAASGLWTAARYRLPLLVVVDNNGGYANSERHAREVALARGRPLEASQAGTRLREPEVDLVSLARAFGVHAIGPVQGGTRTAEAVAEGAAWVRAAKGPALVDVRTRTTGR